MWKKLWEIIEDGKKAKVKEIVAPPPLCSNFEKPDKKAAIAKHRSRFSKQS